MDLKFLINKWRLRLDQDFSVKKGGRHFWVVMVPSYDNLGDSAITEATVQFLRKSFPDFSVKEVSELTRPWQYRYLKNKMNYNDIIILPGGGNLGEIWPVTETMRQEIVNEFSGKKMISFPQSYSFLDKKNIIEINAKKIYSKNVNLFLFRDFISKERFEKSFSIDAHLFPDIVMTTFSYFSNKNIKKEYDILTILRSDKEKNIKSEQDTIVGELANWWRLEKTDTKPLKGELVTRRNRKKLIDQKSLQISKSKLVITDRLHGLILSRAQGIPVVLFSNADGKVLNLYNTWLKDDKGVFVADKKSVEEVCLWINHNIGRVIEPQKFDYEFEKLKSEIEKVIYD